MSIEIEPSTLPSFLPSKGWVVVYMNEKKLTRRAGVSVPSTSKRQMVFFMGRSSRGGNLGAVVSVIGFIVKVWVTSLENKRGKLVAG